MNIKTESQISLCWKPMYQKSNKTDIIEENFQITVNIFRNKFFFVDSFTFPTYYSSSS